MRTRIASALLFLPLVSLGAAKGPEPPTPRGTWISARTENFVLYSNAAEKQTREVARQLELFRLLLGRIATRIRLTSPAPTTMLVFDGEKAFAPYRPDANVRGVFARRTDGNFAAFIARPYIAPSARNLDQSSHFPYETVYHEYVHYVLENSFVNVPRWLNEGMAEYYSMFRLDGDTAQFGFPRSVSLNNMLYGSWIPLDDMLRFGPLSRADASMFYPQAWFVTHYILSGDAPRLQSLDMYLQLLEQGTPSEKALTNAFHTDLDTFAKDLRRYLAANQFYAASMVLEPPRPVSVDIAPLSSAAVLTQLGAWLARLDADRYAEAEAHFREALRLDAMHVLADVELGYVLDRTDRPTDAEAAYRRALVAEPRNYHALFHYGWHLVTRAIRAPASTAPGVLDAWLDDARRCFSACVTDQPQFAEAHFGLGLTFLHRREPSTEGQASIERAWKATPSRMDMVYHAILLAQATGNQERADELLQKVLKRFPGLFLEYASVAPEWEWHARFAVPPSQPAKMAAAVLRSVALVADPEIRSGLEEWARRLTTAGK